MSHREFQERMRWTIAVAQTLMELRVWLLKQEGAKPQLDFEREAEHMWNHPRWTP